MIYLDHAATTPTDPEVLERMLPYFSEAFGNASSPHLAGRRASAAADLAREEVASLLGARPARLVFTSGATEGLNAVIKGLAHARPGLRILVGATEHKAALSAAEAAGETAGAQVQVLPSAPDGVLDLDALSELLHAGPGALVVAMDTNNETGVINPVERIAELTHEHGALLLCDMTQAAGKRPVDFSRSGADFAVASAHKLYGPQGVGCVVAARGFGELHPLLHGGGQERAWRSGTLNLPGVVGLGAAAALAATRLVQDQRHAEFLMAVLLEGLGVIEGIRVHGADAPRVPHILNVHTPGIDGDVLLARVPALALATGSACNSHVPAPSHVLLAMGLGEQTARQSVRVSVGRTSTEEDVRQAAAMLVREYREARQLELT